jgi:hypothetical protein
MNKIKVYDLKSYIENLEFDGKKYILFDFNDGITVIEGTKNIIVIDEEGVGFIKDNIEEEFDIGINDIPESEHILFGTAKYRLKINAKEIIENCSYKEMLLTEFIERYNYNERLRRNFTTLLKTIDQIGLNSKNYYNGGAL